MTSAKSKVSQLDARLQGFVAGASKELAAKLNVPVDQIELVEASYVTWRDSSLGCPRRGMSYLQVLVDGTRIKLRGAGKIYHYHSGRNRKPSLCTTPALNEPLPSGSGDA